MATNLGFNKGQGGLGRPLAGTDHISGLLFYTGATLPTGFDSNNRVKKVFSLEEAEDLGITDTSLGETKSTATFLVTNKGAVGDTHTLTVTSASGETLTLCSYTQVTADVSSTSTAADRLAAEINLLTYSHGFSASVNTATVTITAAAGQGIYLNSGTPYVSTISGTLAGTLTQNPVVAGVRTVRELSGHLINQNNLADLDLSLRYGDSDIQAKASVENLMHRIFKNERLVRASGKVQSSQLFTRDLIFDSLRAPQVDERLSNFSFEFLLSNVLPVEEADFNEQRLQFDIRNLKAHLDKLPDIRDFDAKGTFRRNPQGIYIGLNSLRLTPPEGSLALSGNLELPEKRQLVVDTRIKLARFPWNYVRELVAEIQDGREPSQKQLAPAAMDRVSADLDIRIVYPDVSV